MPDTPLSELCELWRDQTSDPFRMSTEEIPERMARFERRSRRSIFNGYLAGAFLVCGFLGLSLLFENALLRIGSALTVAAFGLMAWNARASQLEERSAAQRAAEHGTSALDFHRGQLERRRDRHQGPRWWAQWLALIPGGLLFFAGFAQARPELTAFIALQALTFVIAIASAVPINRRGARKCQQQLDALDRLKE